MYFRKLSGLLLLGTLWVSASCGDDNKGSGVLGFGTACTTDKECEAYELQCGPDDKCIQCVTSSDCKSNERCLANLCKVPDECETTRDCKNDQVCNERASVCVECLFSSDCAKGARCTNNSCVSRQPCKFTSDCSNNLLCDADAGFCVSCRDDGDCSSRRVCDDNECVVPPEPGEGGAGGEGTAGSSGSSGSSGTAGNGGRAGSGGTGGSGGNGGVSGGGTAGGGMSGGGMGGMGGEPNACGCLDSEECTPDDERCVDAGLIDDFVVCDNEILAIAGRTGTWAASADFDVVIGSGYSDPGASFGDRTCAAWLTGGAVENGTETTFAYIGFSLNQGAAYDLSGYLGLDFVLESNGPVQVELKTTGGGSFQYTVAAAPDSAPRSAPFSLMTKMDDSTEEIPPDLQTVNEVRFAAPDRTEFALAVHQVSLY